eukprot:scaffold15874_cov150-Isochrysis_galbana.AAC.8
MGCYHPPRRRPSPRRPSPPTTEPLVAAGGCQGRVCSASHRGWVDVAGRPKVGAGPPSAKRSCWSGLRLRSRANFKNLSFGGSFRHSGRTGLPYSHRPLGLVLRTRILPSPGLGVVLVEATSVPPGGPSGSGAGAAPTAPVAVAARALATHCVARRLHSTTTATLPSSTFATSGTRVTPHRRRRATLHSPRTATRHV